MRERLAGHGRIAAGAVAVLVLIGAGALIASGGGRSAVHAVRAVAPGGGGGEEVNLDPAAIAKERAKAGSPASSSGSGHAQVVVAVPPGQASDQPGPSSNSHAHAPTDAQIQHDLSEFRRYLNTIPPTMGKTAAVISTGEAAAPFDAPQTVIDVVQAANQIALTPYKWGGGHGAWRDKGYDCSGSVSFALAAAGLLDQPLDSTRFEHYGAPGPGRWITIYANATHAWMTVAGLRFDTGGLRTGTRWQKSMRPTAGFITRHPPGF